ncbi:hypothetical protein ACE1SV_73030 [Streptomyces sennicomposti]
MWDDADGGAPTDAYPHLRAVREHLPGTVHSAFPGTLELLLARFAARVGRQEEPRDA